MICHSIITNWQFKVPLIVQCQLITFCHIFLFHFFFAIKGQWVWIKPQKNSEFALPIGCQIVRFDRGKALIRNDEDEESWIKPDQVIYKRLL